MEHGYLYYGDDGIPLGDAQIMLGNKMVRYDDEILSVSYTINGPK